MPPAAAFGPLWQHAGIAVELPRAGEVGGLCESRGDGGRRKGEGEDESCRLDTHVCSFRRS